MEDLESMRKRLAAAADVVAPVVAAVETTVVVGDAPGAAPSDAADDGVADIMAAWKDRWSPQGLRYCTAEHYDYLSAAGTKPVPPQLAHAHIVTVFKEYGVPAVSVVATTVGPQVTTFAVELEAGAVVSTLKNKEVNVAFGLGAKSVRLLPYMEGRLGCIGLEVPNAVSAVVAFRDVLAASLPTVGANKDKYIGVALGLETSGRPHILRFGHTNSAHLLIAGKSGSGKSVAVDTVLASIVASYLPSECAIVIVDPKQLDYTKWAAAPHLLLPPVTATADIQRILGVMAAPAGGGMTSELDRRNRMFGEFLVNNLADYNAAVAPSSRLPRIVIVIDEYADLMVQGSASKRGTTSAASEITQHILRIATVGRAAGIHMVLATQRPTADTVHPTIRAQTTQIACRVNTSIDSEVILGRGVTGAEKLLGEGDAFVQSNEGLTRVKCAWVKADDINALLRTDVLARALAVARGDTDYTPMR